jgi:hypothetical protein
LRGKACPLNPLQALERFARKLLLLDYMSGLKLIDDVTIAVSIIVRFELLPHDQTRAV